MTDPAIVVEQLSKEYTLSTVRPRHDTLRDHLAHGWKSVLRGNGKTTPAANSFWALKNVSFTVEHGEVVGVIGANGAGKSTLLKILSRITQPTSGGAAIHGRVASLLEVGTGFQPELSGRENVFLSGAILGMRKKEIVRRFDEIVEFSGIDKFIDTPVKRYSSGMYVRLAFAVAAHLEPEIMLVDEVLAVGDAAFQKKCLGKIKDVVTQGRTVLFVSHNMAAVLNLCGRAVLLNGGHVTADGATDTVVSRYLQALQRNEEVSLAERTDRSGSQALRFVAVELRDAAGRVVQRVQSGQSVTIALRYESRGTRRCRNVRASVAVHGRFDENLFELSTLLNGVRFETLPQNGTLLCTIPGLPLQPGKYSFNVYCEVGSELADWVLNAGSIEVEPGDFFGSGRLPHADQGPFLVRNSWSLAAQDNVTLTPSGV